MGQEAFNDIVELADPGGAKPFHELAWKWFERGAEVAEQGQERRKKDVKVRYLVRGTVATSTVDYRSNNTSPGEVSQ